MAREAGNSRKSNPMLKDIAALSYSLAALAFFFQSVLLMTNWRGRVHGVALTIACLFSGFWAMMVAYQVDQGTVFSLLTSILEILRNAAWTFFLLILLAPYQKKWFVFMCGLKPFSAVILIFYGLLFLAAIFMHVSPDSMQEIPAFMVVGVGRVFLAVIGMFLVEQLYRNTPVKDRWGIKFACLGIGAMFTYDFYLYSDAMLFRHINGEAWAARGVINALTVPLLAVSTARNPTWSAGIAVSRHVLFHSATIFGSAFYLLTMAAVGYYLRFFGGNWGTVLQVAFLFGALMLLIGVLFSGSFRSWLKVFISKHFYNYNYDYREEWLRFTRTLSIDGPDLGLRAVQAVAGLVESPGGALWIARESGDCEPVAHWSLPQVKQPEALDSAFCQFLESKQWVIDLNEYRIQPKQYDLIVMPDWLRTYNKAWLVVPLILHGKLFGFVILAEPRSRIKLNWEVTDLLKIAGSQAASYLAQKESANALMVARQFESFNRMSTFVVHDLKNLVSQLSLLLPNAEKHKNNPEFQKDMLDTVDYSVKKMRLLLHKLNRESSVETPAPLPIDKLLQQAVALKSTAIPKPVLEIVDSGLKVFAVWGRLERVIGHIIQNAIEATAKDGQVLVRLLRQGEFVVVECKDNGQGMSEDFIHERLFKPFESTKAAGMGIGAFESREYIHELGGRLEVASRQSIGTTFRLMLLCHDCDDAVVKRT